MTNLNSDLINMQTFYFDLIHQGHDPKQEQVRLLMRIPRVCERIEEPFPKNS